MEVNTDEDGEAELELDDDPAHAARLDTAQVPVLVTVSQARACSLSALLWHAGLEGRYDGQLQLTSSGMSPEYKTLWAVARGVQ